MRGPRVEQRRNGVRLEAPRVGRDFLVDWLLTYNPLAMHTVYGENDRSWGDNRRFIALSGLRLAYDMLQPRKSLIYTAGHFPKPYASDLTAYAKTISDPSIAEIYSGNFLAGVTKAQFDTIQEALLNVDFVIAADAHDAAIIAELSPDWQCAPNKGGLCIESLDLPRALTPQSWNRLAGRLDLFAID